MAKFLTSRAFTELSYSTYRMVRIAINYVITNTNACYGVSKFVPKAAGTATIVYDHDHKHDHAL